MNINNNTLLSTLLKTAKTLDPLMQAKLEKLSVDGKVDIASTIKDKGVQTLLSGLLKDLSLGVQTKGDVASVLATNEKNLNPKNIAGELKQIITLVKSDLKITPQIEKLLDVLKSSLLNIKTIDAKALQNNITNSGVFLESKVLEQKSSVAQNLSLLSTQLKSQLTLLQSVVNDGQISNKSDNAKPRLTQNLNLQQIAVQKDFQTIVKTIESLKAAPVNIDKSLSVLTNVTEQIDKLDQKLLANNSSNLLILPLKESVAQLKNNFLLDGFLNLKKMIVQITEQVQNYAKGDIVQIGKELNTIEQKILVLQENKPNDLKVSLLKDILVDYGKVLDKINSGNIQELLKNNLGNVKNISEDLKANILVLKEIVEKSSPLESQNKELKVMIEKTLASIDYYQLSSFSSNANHSFLSFLQDELEDVDIKFNNQKDEFSCMINLSLKEYGDLKVLLVLDEKSELSINIGVEQEVFKKMIQVSLQKLRTQINSVGLLLVNLNVFDINHEKSDELKAYSGQTAIDFGLDMKV